MKPMSQGVISAFKASYLTRTFRQVVGATVGDRAFSVAEFWKKYCVQHALQNLQAGSTGAWYVQDGGSFEPTVQITLQDWS